ncbi:MAG: hypothetical protein OXP09_09810 [Gammaproteobacteria bacterium]|nr:hypothetical protein [Gammaproteobacteria bacterium]MDE0365854.1 hypothetical protein [Gammaproteobacteria bacterium]
MTNAKAITVIKTDPPQEREDEWNEWYSNVHSPGRFECGFLAFRRFEIVPDQPQVDTRQGGQAKYLAIMELPNTDVLTSPAYDAVTERWMATPPDSFEHQTMKLPKLARGVLELIGLYPDDNQPLLPETRYVFLSAHEVPAAIAEEFNEWYVEEHMPLVLCEPGFNAVRRYAHLSDEFPPILGEGGELFTHLSIWDIDGIEAFQNPKFANYTVTPWQKRMRRLFTLKMSNIYREIARAVAPD